MEQHQTALNSEQAAAVATAIDATIGFRTQRGVWGTAHRNKLARELVQTMGEFGHKVLAWDDASMVQVKGDTGALRFLRSAIDSKGFKKPGATPTLPGAGR